MGDENRLVWQPLRKELQRLRWHAQRIEDKLTMGIPDANIHVPGAGDVWVELKYVSRMTPSVHIGLRREQYLWLLTGQRAGRTCWLLARIGVTGWYLWNDAATWELAKHPAPWSLLARTAVWNQDASGVLLYLANGERK